MKKLIKRYDIIFTVLLFFLIIPAERFEWFSTFENQTLSLRHLIRVSYGDVERTRFLQEKISIVDLNESFFEEYNGYPLKRKDIATIVKNIGILGAKVIVVDILMDFPSSYGEDPATAEIFKEYPNTIVVSRLTFQKKQLKGISYPVEPIKSQVKTGYSNHSYSGTMVNRLRVFPEAVDKFNEWPISVKAAAMYLGVNPKLENGYLKLGDFHTKLDQFNDFRVDFPLLKVGVPFLSKDPFVGIPAMDILDLDIEDPDEIAEMTELLEGKIVFLGDTSIVSHDIFDTITGEVYGVEIMADEVSTLLKSGPLKSASLFTEVMLALIFLVALIYIHFISDPRVRFLGTIGLFIIYISFCTILYVSFGLAFSMSYTLTAGALGYILINVYLFIQERKQKSYIKNAFGQYLSPAVIDIIVEDPSKLSLGGERRDMTAFFSDIQGFSTISESLTPDELVKLLNEYLTDMCDIISSYNGTVDKFEGDAIIAFWGAPLTQPEHAKLCCHATIDMQKRMVEMREQLLKEGRPKLLVRMGVNSGPMVVGNMGSQSRMDYTMMGDAVNLAARLEGANKFYKNFSMISEFTYEKASDHIDVRELDTIRVVGKNEPITVYDLLDKKNQVSGKLAELVERYNKGLELYKKRDYKSAILAFQQALKVNPLDGPSLTYLERCQEYLKTPPQEEWDGVYTLTGKG